MGFLDILKTAAGGVAEQEGHQALDSVLQGTPLGGMTGLLDQLSQSGLGAEVDAWRQGDRAQVGADAIKAALGDQHVQAIAAQMGISPDDLAQHLSEHLPALAAAQADDSSAGDQDADQEAVN